MIEVTDCFTTTDFTPFSGIKFKQYAVPELLSRYSLQAKDLQERSADKLKLSGFEKEQYLKTHSLFCTLLVHRNNQFLQQLFRPSVPSTGTLPS